MSSKSKPQPCEASPWQDHLAKSTLNVILIMKHVLIRSRSFSVLCEMSSLYIRDSEHVSRVSMWGVRESPPVGRGTRGSRAAASGSVPELCLSAAKALFPTSSWKTIHELSMGLLKCSMSWYSTVNPWESERKEYRTIHSWTPTIFFFLVPKFLVWIHLFFGIFSFFKSFGKMPRVQFVVVCPEDVPKSKWGCF